MHEQGGTDQTRSSHRRWSLAAVVAPRPWVFLHGSATRSKRKEKPEAGTHARARKEWWWWRREGGEGREEGLGEAMDGGELRRREVAAAIWKGGGGVCDLEGTSADPTAAVGEKGRGGESPRCSPPTRSRGGSVELAGRKGTGSRGARVCAGEEGDGIERSEGKK